MNIRLHLDPRTLALLDRLARARRQSRSAVMADGLASLVRQPAGVRGRAPTAYELMRPFLGRVRSDGSLLAGDWKADWTAYLRKKHFGECVKRTRPGQRPPGPTMSRAELREIIADRGLVRRLRRGSAQGRKRQGRFVA